jgi:hypothetical protein
MPKIEIFWFRLPSSERNNTVLEFSHLIASSWLAIRRTMWHVPFGPADVAALRRCGAHVVFENLSDTGAFLELLG